VTDGNLIRVVPDMSPVVPPHLGSIFLAQCQTGKKSFHTQIGIETLSSLYLYLSGKVFVVNHFFWIDLPSHQITYIGLCTGKLKKIRETLSVRFVLCIGILLGVGWPNQQPLVVFPWFGMSCFLCP
jgi:hypothetical protein